MATGRFYRLFENEETRESTRWCGYCMAIVVTLAAALYVFFVCIIGLKN
jgi:hypothetical protein